LLRSAGDTPLDRAEETTVPRYLIEEEEWWPVLHLAKREWDWQAEEEEVPEALANRVLAAEKEHTEAQKALFDFLGVKGELHRG
jgi:hypothetical protein